MVLMKRICSYRPDWLFQSANGSNEVFLVGSITAGNAGRASSLTLSQCPDCLSHIDKVVGDTFGIRGKFKIERTCHRGATAV